MRDVKRYWREVREIEAALPDFVWLVSAKGSAPVEVAAHGAALLLHAKSHRIATEEEVAALKASEHAIERHQRKERLRKSGVAVVEIG